MSKMVTYTPIKLPTKPFREGEVYCSICVNTATECTCMSPLIQTEITLEEYWKMQE